MPLASPTSPPAVAPCALLRHSGRRARESGLHRHNRRSREWIGEEEQRAAREVVHRGRQRK